MSAASTSALSSVLSALNNGNAGIDVTSAVASIIAAESAPEQAWQSQQTTLNNQASELQQLESEASAVTDSLQSLSDAAGPLSSIQATSADPSVLTASAQSGTASGTHTVVVNSLAATASWYSAEQSGSTAALSNGTFQITGGGASTTFNTGSGGSADLTDLASAINSAGVGLTASIVNDASGARLSLVANNSGAAADFSVTTTAGLSFTRSATGADASLTFDGVPVSSATNTVTDAIQGLTLSLQSAPTPPVPVTVGLAPDTSTIESTLSTFVSAYNQLVTDLNSQFTYNTSTASEGVLASDSVARSLQNDVLGAANLNIGSGAYSNLTSLGITTNQDGTLSLDTTTLDNALSSNYQGVVDFFQGSNGSPGFASTLSTTLNNYTDTSQGAFTVDLQSFSSEYTDLTNQINMFQLYLNTQQTTLTTEYNNANIALQQLPQQIKQVDALLGFDNSGSSS